MMSILRKGFIRNSILSIISNGIPIALLQLFILPRIAEIVGKEVNGQILTLIGLLSLTSEPIGGALNNARLLMQTKYNDLTESGDFTRLILIVMPINILIVISGIIYFNNAVSAIDLILLSIASSMLLLQRYYVAYFRIELNYKRILIDSAILSLGYLCGTVLFTFLNNWIYIYLCGNMASLFYTLYKNSLAVKRLTKTELYKQAAKKTGTLLFVSITNSITKYADRLIIYPMMDGAAVSVYIGATIISKMILMAVSPICSVELSYFSKMKTLTKKNFALILTASTAVGGIAYIVCILLAKPLLLHLYPDWAKDSLVLVYYTTAVAVMDSITSTVRPAILRFRSNNWQFVFGIFDVTTYLSLSYFTLAYSGLLGFCQGLLLYSFGKLILRIIVFTFAHDV